MRINFTLVFDLVTFQQQTRASRIFRSFCFPLYQMYSGFPPESSFHFTARFKMAASSPDPNLQRESPLPTVNERLGHLKPSRELLEYYRRKIAEYDGEYEEMVKKLELYKCTYEEQVATILAVGCFGMEKKIKSLLFLPLIVAQNAMGIKAKGGRNRRTTKSSERHASLPLSRKRTRFEVVRGK